MALRHRASNALNTAASAVRLPIAMSLVSGLLACGDATPSAEGTSTAGSQWFALATNVFLPDGSVGYVIGTATLDEQELSLADSIEVSSGGMVHSAGDGAVFAGSFDSPVYTRYEVGVDGRLVEAGRMSFAGVGLASSGFNPNAVQFVAPDRAYILTESQVILWDPSAMAIVGELPMPGLERPGFSLGMGYTTFRRGAELVWTLQWSDGDGAAVLAETALAVLNIDTHELTVTSRSGCGGAVWGAMAEDGTIYWSSGAYDAAIYRLSSGERAGAPCLVRLEPGASQLAEEVELLGSFTGGRLAGGLWGVQAGRATLRLFEDAEYPLTLDTTPADLTFRAPWSWYWVDLATRELTRIDELGENGGSVFTYQVGERALVPAIPVTEDSTVLWDVTAGEGSPRRSVSTMGNVYAAVRAR
jgi:hypothetical protein